MTSRLAKAKSGSLDNRFVNRSDKWPFDDRDVMSKVWMSVVLWKYDLSGQQLEEIRDILQLFCAESIKAYRASK